MKLVIMIGMLSALAFAPITAGADPCEPTTAPGYSKYGDFYLVTGPSHSPYVGSPAHHWIYEESNGIYGPQRGGVGVLGDWFPPGCDQTPFGPGDVIELPGDFTVTVNPFGTVGVPCVLIDEAPMADENCGAGPDTLII